MAEFSSCGHFKSATIDGVCMTCERVEMDSHGPLVSFAGGKDNWHNGLTTSEWMRGSKAMWEADGLTGDRAPIPVGGKSRWV
jgi:hypothetical protein